MSIFLVIQHGGSSTEMYPHLFDTIEDAKSYIDSAWEEGAYECDGPFELHGVMFEEEST